MEIPRSSVIRILDELEEELQIKYEEVIENGREKHKVFVGTINDFTHTYFKVQNLDVPLIRKLIENSQNKGLDVTIRMEDGSEQVLRSEMAIEEFRSQHNIA